VHGLRDSVLGRHIRRTGDAGQVRQEQRLHRPEPAGAGAGQPDAPGHHLLGLLGRVSHNATIAPGASVAIGFQAAHTGDTATPLSFTLNGTICAVN
jgi:hypothetical protein